MSWNKNKPSSWWRGGGRYLFTLIILIQSVFCVIDCLAEDDQSGFILYFLKTTSCGNEVDSDWLIGWVFVRLVIQAGRGLRKLWPSTPVFWFRPQVLTLCYLIVVPQPIIKKYITKKKLKSSDPTHFLSWPITVRVSVVVWFRFHSLESGRSASTRQESRSSPTPVSVSISLNRDFLWRDGCQVNFSFCNRVFPSWMPSMFLYRPAGDAIQQNRCLPSFCLCCVKGKLYGNDVESRIIHCLGFFSYISTCQKFPSDDIAAANISDHQIFNHSKGHNAIWPSALTWCHQKNLLKKELQTHTLSYLTNHSASDL